VAVEKRFTDANAHTAQVEQRLAVERQRHEAAAANAAALEAVRTELQSQLAAAHRVNADLQRHIAALNGERDATEQRIQDADRQANERVAQDIEQQTIELIELRDEVRTLHTRIAPLESLLKQRDSALFERSERIEAMTSQIEALVAQDRIAAVRAETAGEKIALLERTLADQPPPLAATADTAIDAASFSSSGSTRRWNAIANSRRSSRNAIATWPPPRSRTN
jgi:chromosome segregation ATPase